MRLLSRHSLLPALIALMATAGCYSGEVLIDKARRAANFARIEEVPLGSYRVTLPGDGKTGDRTEIIFDLFGQTERYKINEIEDQLEYSAPQIEDETLRSIRQVTAQELTDPDLELLRKRLLSSFNNALDGAPLKSIGFHEVRFIRH